MTVIIVNLLFTAFKISKTKNLKKLIYVCKHIKWEEIGEYYSEPLNIMQSNRVSMFDKAFLMNRDSSEDI